MRDKIIKEASNKVTRKKKIIKIAKLTLLFLILILLILYIVMGVIYNTGSFSITLDRNLYTERNIIIYDDPNYKEFRTELYAESMEYFDDIKYTWLPNNLHDSPGGSHNGDNYIAYTFFAENLGKETTDYWTEIVIDDVIKGVDEAIRIRVYRNGEEKTYAKMGRSGQPEVDTIPFQEDRLVVREHIRDFKPKDIDKYTIVIWLEGTDPECTDNIIGGEIKLHMDFKSEIVKK